MLTCGRNRLDYYARLRQRTTDDDDAEFGVEEYFVISLVQVVD